MSKIKVEKSEPPETKTVLAEAIVNIGNAAKQLADSGLNERAIIVLLHHKTRVSVRDIKIILDGLKQLESWYCR